MDISKIICLQCISLPVVVAADLFDLISSEVWRLHRHNLVLSGLHFIIVHHRLFANNRDENGPITEGVNFMEHYDPVQDTSTYVLSPTD